LDANSLRCGILVGPSPQTEASRKETVSKVIKKMSGDRDEISMVDLLGCFELNEIAGGLQSKIPNAKTDINIAT
jgi:hypothetical protein